MHPGDGDSIFQAHELRQHLCTLDHRNVVSVGFGEFEVVRAYGGAGNDYLGSGDVLCFVCLEDRCAQFRQALGYGRALQI